MHTGRVYAPAEWVQQQFGEVELGDARCCRRAAEACGVVLRTSVAVTQLAQALTVADWYSLRWLVQEYHKCLKSGARSSSGNCGKRIGWSRVSACWRWWPCVCCN